jgi:hypothetical protein
MEISNIDEKTLPPILTAQDIADILNYLKRNVYELMKIPAPKGGIPCFKPGGEKSQTKRVRRSDFVEWLERKVKGSINDEI